MTGSHSLAAPATDRAPIEKIVILIPDAEPMRDRIATAFPDIDVSLGDPREDAGALADADMAIGWWISEEALATASRLRWFHIGAAGVEHILSVPGFTDRGLILTNSSGISAPNMAEHAIALMLTFARKLPGLFRSQAERHWQDWYAGRDTFELGGQTVVLAGLGAIGLEIARRAKGLDMHVVGLRRTVGGALPPHVDEVIALDDLDTALARADHVINVLPFTPDTTKLFDADRFAAMKAGSYFYNLGRGTTVDQDALIAALKSGHIAGAGLDVTDPEPLNEDSELWAMENVFITAHTSGNSPMVRPRLIDLCIEQVRRYRDGEDLLNVVDQTQGY
ncbi:MAG TPA: D-2-hydroxyacid dehydrogenase [Thermomicrobiales bacterium]|nr:D-2-hydroxyacid dehydrogenase [Thermomicrobiales bacterium]